MSINVYRAAGVSLLEQPGDREFSPHGAEGRLDLLTCMFMGEQGAFSDGHHASLKAWFVANFRPYSAHPDAATTTGLRGWHLLPGSVVGRSSWNGLARIAATYIGVIDAPKLPDAYVEATTGNQIGLASEGIASASLAFDTNFVVSVDYNAARSPELSGLVNKRFRVDGIAQGNSPNNRTMQVLQRSDIIARHGPYTILRHAFVPVFVGAINPQVVISNNRAINATVPLSGSLFDGSARVQGGKVVSMTNCRQGDSFLNRLGGPSQ